MAGDVVDRQSALSPPATLTVSASQNASSAPRRRRRRAGVRLHSKIVIRRGGSSRLLRTQPRFEGGRRNAGPSACFRGGAGRSARRFSLGCALRPNGRIRFTCWRSQRGSEPDHSHKRQDRAGKQAKATCRAPRARRKFEGQLALLRQLSRPAGGDFAGAQTCPTVWFQTYNFLS
jgi:hypothetical protein